jgi:SAM-dependent methyltransferase
VFVEEAAWVERALARLELPAGARVLDVGSSTREFRTEVQPHIDRHVFAPLRARGVRPVHLDAKDADGVDVVLDLSDPALDPAAALGERFDVVLCMNMLEHVVDRERTADRVLALVAPGGHLLVTVPRSYRRHLDPIDTMYRPSPRERARLFRGRRPGVELVLAETVPIARSEYYRYHRSRNPLWARRETLRRRVPPLRWKQACILLRCP